MSSFSVMSIVFLLYNGALISSLNEGYYWRPYTGPIPDDAFIGGQDVNGENIYIGQVFVYNKGLIAGEIFPRTRELIVPLYGPMSFTYHVKILCGPQENFFWIPANATSLHLTLQTDKYYAVVGGYEEEEDSPSGSTNIGRVSLEGGVKIGKIDSFVIGKALLFYTHERGERETSSYEVLVYKNNTDKF